MTSDFAELQEQRNRFLEAVYELGRNAPGRIAYKPAIGERLGIDPEGNLEDEARYESLAQDLIKDGYIIAESEELGLVKITPAGRRRVEGGGL